MEREVLTYCIHQGEPYEIVVNQHECEPEIFDDDERASDKGHLYEINGTFTLGDIATLARLLQQREAPAMSARDWAHLSNLKNTLREGGLEEDDGE